MSEAKESIRKTLDEARAFLSQELPPKLSEADTKANFVEPIVSALGWHGIEMITREYFVKSSQEYIDYMLSHEGRPLLAIEAKPLQTNLNDKAAAQLVQYCSVEGVEWAALTNGRELQFFNTFQKPDLDAKRILNVNLLEYENDDEFDVLFQQLSQLSRKRLSSPDGTPLWLKQRRMNETLRSVLVDLTSPTIKAMRKALKEAEVETSSAEIVRWVQSMLSNRTPPVQVNREIEVPDETALDPGQIRPAVSSATQSSGSKKVFVGIKLKDLLDAGLVSSGEKLVLVRGSEIIAEAELATDGYITWKGNRYKTLSDKAFATAMGNQSLNGWTSWFVNRPQGRRSMDSIRSAYQTNRDD